MIELTSGELMASITVLVLSIFLGFELISKVPPTLHTPLMSGANAISGITVVGALACTGAAYSGAGSVFGFIAIALATASRRYRTALSQTSPRTA